MQGIKMSESTVIKPVQIIDKEYIRFLEYEIPERKTKYWAVRNKKHGTRLGDIEWYGAWRKYCFFTVDGIVFDQKCMLEIVKFMHRQNLRHRAKLQNERFYHAKESEVKPCN